MGNTLKTPQAIANIALYQLQNTRVMTDLINKNYSDEFVAKGDTVNVRVPAVLVGKTFLGEVERQDVTETTKPVKLDRIADVSVRITSKEMALDLNNFEEQIVKPAVIALNDKIDGDIANFIFDNVGHTIAGTDATDLSDIAKIANYLDNKRAPLLDRHLVLCPDHKYKYALKENLTIVNYAGTSETLREALLGKLYSITTYMSQNLPYSLADTAGTATTYKVNDHADAGYVVLSSVDPATGTVAEGDGFVVNGKVFYFTESKTASGGNIAKIGITEATGLTEATDVKLLTKKESIAFHRDAFTFATRPLDEPLGGADSAIASGEGFSIRVTFDYDSKTNENLISFDVLYGISKLHDGLSVRLKG